MKQEAILFFFCFSEVNINQSIQFSSGFIAVNRGVWIYTHSNSNLSYSHSPSRSIEYILLLKTNTLALLFHLRLSRLLWLSSLPLALHFKLQRFSWLITSELATQRVQKVPFIYSVVYINK